MEEINIDSSKFKSSTEYVCWLDIMGTRSTMSESFEKAANFLLRFHSCVISAVKDEEKLHYYPVMDGVYIASPQKEALAKALKSILNNLSDIFIEEEHINHRFVIRGAIARGDIAHGCNITSEICDIVASAGDYKNTVMMGLPMIQAYTSEHLAPPFGIYIHESARVPNALQGRFFAWCKSDKRLMLKQKINEYFDWCSTYFNYLEMDKIKIEHYRQMNKEHLTNIQCTYDKLEKE